MRAGFSFSYPSISLLLGQPLSIKRAMQERYRKNDRRKEKDEEEMEGTGRRDIRTVR
jgi:hypothetical protein